MGSRVRLGNLAARRDWGVASDYTQAMLLIANHDRAEDFVAATGASHSVWDWVESALTRIGIGDWQDRVLTDEGLLRPDDPPSLIGDASKARSVLGWQPTVLFESLVALMLDDSIYRLRDASR